MKVLGIRADMFEFSPETYPGKRPRFSFLFNPSGIYPLQLRALDRALRERGLPAVDQRYAILAYGSNACPGQLLKKGLSDVPVIFGRLAGAEAVYAGRQAGNGYVPATLARKNGIRPSWITLLTAEQLRKMDATEGRAGGYYALARLPEVEFAAGRRKFVPLYTYVNMRGGVLTANKQPVALRSMGQKKARSLIERGEPQAAATTFLDFVVIPYPDIPPTYSTSR